MSFFKRIFRNRLSSRYREGIEAFNAGNWEQARGRFRAALAAGGSSSDPLSGLARFYAAEASSHLARAALESADPQGALRWLQPALQWSPRHTGVLFLAALSYAEIGDLQATDLTLRALRSAPSSHVAHAEALAAAVAFARGHRDAARQYLARAQLAGHPPRASDNAVVAVLGRVIDRVAPGFSELQSWMRHLGGDASSRRA